MALTVVTGLGNAGKSGHVYDRVRQTAAAGLSPVLVLPSEPEVQRAVGEFSGSAPLGVSVLQFDRYLDSLWSILGDGRTIVGRVQRTLLLQQALAVAPPEVLQRSARHTGFLRILEVVVQRAAERPGGAKLVSRPGAPRTPAGEILDIAAAYAGLLAQAGLVESEEAYRIVAATVEAKHIGGPLAVNRFGSFTPAQLAFLTRAAALDVEVIVALTWENNHPATTAASETVDYLSGLPGARTVVAEDQQIGSPELAHLEKELFSEHLVGPGSDARDDLVFSEAAGLSGEAQRIVRDIQELVISGIPAHAIAVVFRRPEAHLSAIREAFNEVGVAADYDVRTPLVRTGLGRALSLLLQHFCGERGRAELTGLLRSGYAWASAGDVDGYDERTRRDRALNAHHLLEEAKSTGPRTRLFLERAHELCAARINTESVEAWRLLVADMMRSRYGSPVILDSGGAADARAQRALMTAIEEMASLGDLEFGARDLLALLDAVGVSLSDGERPGHVQVMSAERARSRRFEAVILGGLVGGEFPANSSDDALSQPALAGPLAVAGIDVLPRGGADEERLLFYQVVTGARQKLILSRTIVDDDGKPLRSSALWEETLDLYRDPATGDLPEVGGPRIRRLTLADMTEHEDAPLSERRTLREQAALPSGGAPRAVLARRRAGARRGCVTGAVAEQLAQRQVFSASEIEAYLACPYRWFYQRELNPRPIDEPIDALERGRVAHEIMSTFYAAWTAAGYERVTPELLPTALGMLADVSGTVLAGRPAARTLMEDEVLRGAVSGAGRIVVRDAEFLPGFVPRHHEWSFGGRNTDTAEPVGSFFLQGRIDRIDVSAAGIVIIDYKTGVVTPRAKFADDGLVQLPLYGFVTSRRLEQPLLGGLYRSMRYGGDRGFYSEDNLAHLGLASRDACVAEEFDAVTTDAIAAAETAVAGMRAGQIPATPRKASTCGYCPARSVCGGCSS